MKSSVLWSDSCKQRCTLQGSRPAIWASSLWVSVSNQPLIAAFPVSLASHYVRSFFFFFAEMSSGLVLNILGVKHPVFLSAMWPRQWPAAFQNDIMGLNSEWLKRSDYGSLETSACLFTFQQVVWRCWTRSLQMSVCFAENRGHNLWLMD